MRNLLDTHTLIWFLNGEAELSDKARKAIQSKNALNFVSIASLWEMAIKVSLGKLELQMPLTQLPNKLRPMASAFYLLRSKTPRWSPASLRTTATLSTESSFAKASTTN